MKRISHSMLMLSLVGFGLLVGCVSSRPLAVDLDGKPVDPFVDTNVTATVFIFVSNDCPMSNRYVPELKRLQDDFGKRGVRFWIVHADPTEPPAEIREHTRQFGLTMKVVRDPEHHLVRLAHAEVTPSAAVFTDGKYLVYRGRIDDRLAELGKERLEPTQRDLVDALEAVLAGRAVPVAVTQAVGCYIPAP